MTHIECEHGPCKEVNHFEQSHSMLIVLQKVDEQGYTYHQCEDGTEINYMTSQHWHCSHEHMKLGVSECITNHHKEHKLHPPYAGTTNMHKIVLRNNLQCKSCQHPLVTVAYRFCLTMATPVNHVPDESHDVMAGWCCSIDCASKVVLATIERLEAQS